MRSRPDGTGPIPPGSTIGIVGGGQLGRMLAIAAAQIGYRCHVFAPDKTPPAADVAAEFTRASFEDVEALRRFAGSVDIATYEFENLCADSLAAIRHVLKPGVKSLEITQDRAIEKQFVGQAGGRVAVWKAIDGEADACAAEEELGLPLVLKTRRFGYDGKGQAWARDGDSAVSAWESIDRQPAIAEAAVDFDGEFSVLLARSTTGETAVWDLPENVHGDGILRRSSVPAKESIARHGPEAKQVAIALAEALDHVGVMAVEFFATSHGPIVNEIAPRVHNSGHWTIEGAITSQFEQHVRAICGLPLGSTALVSDHVVMDNLIGDDAADWQGLLAAPGAHVHLYGKNDARPGRKMGHVTRLGPVAG